MALITDGRFSGGTAGACIGHVSPEAAAGGPIGLLEPATSSKSTSRPNAQRPPERRGTARRAALEAPPPLNTGYLAKYATMATSADTGAVLRWKSQ